MSFLSDHSESESNSIPVQITIDRTAQPLPAAREKPVRVTIKRNNLIIKSINLPVIMNINPRSIYNKSEEFSLLLEQYGADVICMSESFERENQSLEQLLDLEDYEIISMVKKRDFKGGNPAILINKQKFFVKRICPDPICVPVGVEAVWALISPKTSCAKLKYIAVCSLYYRGPKSTKKQELFDHIAETYHWLSAKYGTHIEYVLAGDTNRLNLSPILNLSPRLVQAVKVPTRLNPDRILDPIITTLKRYYLDPETKPPINPDKNSNGKPSDHLTVIMRPLSASISVTPRIYRTVETRPITESGLQLFRSWIEEQRWLEVYTCKNAHEKAERFQHLVMDNFQRCFPLKRMKVCDEDQPWASKSLKRLDRLRKREFYKHKQSEKWFSLNRQFEEKCAEEKSKYFQNIVSDLKESNISQWYSKVKRMAGQDQYSTDDISVDELIGLSNPDQAEKIADHYASISNLYQPLTNEDFLEFSDPSKFTPPKISPSKIAKIISSMNKKAAAVPGDLPMRIIAEFSDELSRPLAHLINNCFSQGIYPNLWKVEYVTPVPKCFPPERLTDLRKIAGLLNFSKITDKIIAEYISEDMKLMKDKSQYGNQKKLSTQHYLINMLHKILTSLDKNSVSNSIAVILQMVDWSQAFDMQSHKPGIKSFMENGVRPSLIPILISFFKKREMVVK